MFVERKSNAQTMKMLSTRADSEMFFALKALSQVTGVDTSTLIRLAIAAMLTKVRTLPQPVTIEDIKQIL
jgi:hypothetical protein